MTGTHTDELLDNPVWAALTGPHRGIAEIHGRAARYQPDVAPFTCVSSDDDPDVWDDLAALVGPGAVVAVTGTAEPLPRGWTVDADIAGVQMIDVEVDAADDPEAVRLTASDLPEMVSLIARTQPGPFLPRTVELGTYLGLRRDGALVAMAGERVHPPGWTEISAVCTAPEVRGQGLATRLVQAVAAGIRARGERPFLHAAASNTTAIRLYESIGFTLRRHTTFRAVRVPDRLPADRRSTV
ncbi:GNAT family N-acetyltransferase [Micromonospora arborensis]|uniref:GNAT family N-acetyltransferase n=1 Tax=Micromonospora arborensis TaxID=2116518 RepID=A0A318NTH4_9ACTN|nr:GNAT family N-acetyltransferase [Micromonospora arborensis]PYC63430.1 GNAT family N-acetyltransferase [Micromonospora arborensis]